ncbi:unnamed protein product [Rotaria socialis]|uniref:Uncharacterized protein n=1 Tax=Rotaria socialis TaxID=392032 RepID=A0A820CGV8_9BILA|nr:unnamed protein product [Rotaria socialis]CAF4208235.1 unnamed protein product [Rotaria socialis]
MAANRSRSPTSANKTRRLGESTLKNSTKQSLRLQSAPPLSIQHFVRYAYGVSLGEKEWKPPGKYCPPPFRSHFSPQIREQTSQSEPVWHLPGPYQDKRPKSFSPAKKREKTIQEAIWHPPGQTREKPVPHFDPPNLRWSVQEIVRSMPNTRSQSLHTSSSMSILRNKTKPQPE